MGLKPINLDKITKHAANIYEATIVASKRARIINDERKIEYDTLKKGLEAFDDDFEDRANPELLKFSREMDKREKPHIQALNELIEGKIKYRYNTFLED
jgi:DNA-directed RNA polymerase subunit K/omega